MPNLVPAPVRSIQLRRVTGVFGEGLADLNSRCNRVNAMSSCRTTLTLVTLAATCPATWARPADKLDPKIEKLVAQVANGKKPEDSAKAIDLLFKRADRNLLRQLKKVPEDGVAIRAAWEEAKLDGKFRKFDYDLPKKAVPNIALSRFYGFIEGRTGLTLPDWWEEAINGSTLDDGIVTPGQPTKAYYRGIRFRGSYCYAMKGQSLTPGVWLDSFQSGSDKSLISHHLVAKYLQVTTSHKLSACLDEDRAFIVSHGDFGLTFPLICVDRKSGRLLWNTTVWGLGGDIFVGTGIWIETVSVICSEDRFFIIGSGVQGFYIESFDKTTGKTLMRFASRYLHEPWDEK
jgi:hypothetical protein